MVPQYYAQNLLSDVLGNGESSRLYQSLKMEQQLFTDISAYVSGSLDTGMFVVSGKLADGVSRMKRKCRYHPRTEKNFSRKDVAIVSCKGSRTW